MGMYLNPGNETFREISNGTIFDDKTGMIAEANRLIRCLCTLGINCKKPHFFKEKQIDKVRRMVGTSGKYTCIWIRMLEKI
mgnify:CR=1 FL=1